MDDLYLWMGKTDYFSFSEKPVRLVLLGTTAATFRSYSYLRIGAEREEKPMAVITGYILYLPDACFPDCSLYCNRKRRMELP